MVKWRITPGLITHVIVRSNCIKPITYRNVTLPENQVSHPNHTDYRATHHFVPPGAVGASPTLSNSNSFHNKHHAPMYGSGCFLSAKSASAFAKMVARARGSCTSLSYSQWLALYHIPGGHTCVVQIQPGFAKPEDATNHG